MIPNQSYQAIASRKSRHAIEGVGNGASLHLLACGAEQRRVEAERDRNDLTHILAGPQWPISALPLLGTSDIGIRPPRSTGSTGDEAGE
jgi:hypothetical protein